MLGKNIPNYDDDLIFPNKSNFDNLTPLSIGEKNTSKNEYARAAFDSSFPLMDEAAAEFSKMLKYYDKQNHRIGKISDQQYSMIPYLLFEELKFLVLKRPMTRPSNSKIRKNSRKNMEYITDIIQRTITEDYNDLIEFSSNYFSNKSLMIVSMAYCFFLNESIFYMLNGVFDIPAKYIGRMNKSKYIENEIFSPLFGKIDSYFKTAEEGNPQIFAETYIFDLLNNDEKMNIVANYPFVIYHVYYQKKKVNANRDDMDIIVTRLFYKIITEFVISDYELFFKYFEAGFLSENEIKTGFDEIKKIASFRPTFYYTDPELRQKHQNIALNLIPELGSIVQTMETDNNRLNRENEKLLKSNKSLQKRISNKKQAERLKTKESEIKNLKEKNILLQNKLNQALNKNKNLSTAINRLKLEAEAPKEGIEANNDLFQIILKSENDEQDFLFVDSKNLGDVLVVSFNKMLKIPKDWDLFYDSGKEGKLKILISKYDTVILHSDQTSHVYQGLVKKYAKKYYLLDSVLLKKLTSELN